MFRLIMISLVSLLLTACAIKHSPVQQGKPSTRVMAELQQGKRYFEQGYYKRAMQELLPLACDGNPEAQYAVGYMYYYGYGVAQDTDVGYFWMKRAADQGYPPAIKALTMIEHHDNGKAARITPLSK